MLDENSLTFVDKKNTYHITFEMQKRKFGYSNYGQYRCILHIKNIFDVPVMDIVGNEKTFMEFCDCITNIETCSGNIYSDRVYFPMQPTGNSIYMEIYSCYDIDFIDVWEKINGPLHPEDDDDDNRDVQYDDLILVSVCENSRMNGNYIRFSLFLNAYEIEDLVYIIWEELQTVPNIRDIGCSILMDCLED